ncbi:MAG: hypothetical protein HY526_11045 [Betaproteobacteria bacterium]|nr:hypothetical protein [Betaproteobacteria bacterium]
MSRWGKLLLIFLPLAILATAGLRFIQHTDREYSHWIKVYGESAARLDARCAAVKTPTACDAARKRAAFVEEFEAHRNDVIAWRWPVLAAMLCAWAATLVCLVALGRRLFVRRGVAVNKTTGGRPDDEERATK